MIEENGLTVSTVKPFSAAGGIPPFGKKAQNRAERLNGNGWVSGWCWLLLLLPAMAGAATITVDGGGGGDFTEIQPALDAASDGDTVLVKPGQYTVNDSIDFNRLLAAGPVKNLILRSEGGPDVTSIRMSQTPIDPAAASVVVFQHGEGSASVVNGFTLTGGMVAAGVPRGGGGITVCGSSPRVERCMVRDNSAARGGGIYCGDGAMPAFVECSVTSNSATEGGGVYVDGALPAFEACTVTENSATSGGAVYCLNASPTFTECTVSGNAASEDGGGGFHCWDANLHAEHCLISENAGSGLLCGGSSAARLIGCGVERNSGGGITCDASFPHLTGCTLRGNRTAGNGGGLHCRNGASPILEACTLIGNMAETGGGVFILDPPDAPAGGPFLFNTVIAGNRAVTGAGVYCSCASPLLVNCTICGNRGDSDAGVAGDGALPRLANCIVWDNVPESSYGTVTHSLVGQDPRFVVPGQFDFEEFRAVPIAGADYELPDFVVQEPDLRLREGSPAIDAGTDVGAPPADGEGTARPCGAGVDIGADEFGSCSATMFRRGDANADARVTISDAVFIARSLVLSGPAPPCADAADVNDDGTVDIADAVTTLSILFSSAPDVPARVIDLFGRCAADVTSDGLPACGYELCPSRDLYAYEHVRGSTLLVICLECRPVETKLAMAEYFLLMREMVKIVHSLNPRYEVSLVYYNREPVVFDDLPVTMDEDGKKLIFEKFEAAPDRDAECLMAGLAASLDIANGHRAGRSEVILAGQGRPMCTIGDGGLDAVYEDAMRCNSRCLPINAVFAGSGIDVTLGLPLLERLARSTNGWFRIAGSPWNLSW